MIKVIAHRVVDAKTGEEAAPPCINPALARQRRDRLAKQGRSVIVERVNA